MSRVNVGQMGWFRGISSNGTVKKGFTIHYNYKELPINIIIEGDRFNITGSDMKVRRYYMRWFCGGREG